MSEGRRDGGGGEGGGVVAAERGLAAEREAAETAAAMAAVARGAVEMAVEVRVAAMQAGGSRLRFGVVRQVQRELRDLPV